MTMTIEGWMGSELKKQSGIKTQASASENIRIHDLTDFYKYTEIPPLVARRAQEIVRLCRENNDPGHDEVMIFRNLARFHCWRRMFNFEWFNDSNQLSYSVFICGKCGCEISGETKRY